MQDEQARYVGRRGGGGARVGRGRTAVRAGTLPAPRRGSLTAARQCERVKNNRNKAITIRAVGSIYRPFGYEPVRVERKLGAGKTVAFESGAGADRNVLTGSFIYNNEVVGSREGARVRTSVGTSIDKC
jgi:hypothetical protein